MKKLALAVALLCGSGLAYGQVDLNHGDELRCGDANLGPPAFTCGTTALIPDNIVATCAVANVCPPATDDSNDGLDNDGDGAIDGADPELRQDVLGNWYEWPDETPPPTPQCSDGIDNDGDTFTDLADPECVDANDDDESPFNPPLPPPPTGTPLSSCPGALSSGEYYLTQDLITTGATCVSVGGGSVEIDLNGFRLECGGAREDRCVEVINADFILKNGTVYNNAEGNPEWPNNFGGPAFWTDSGNIVFDNVAIHCEATLKNVDYGCVQVKYSGTVDMRNTHVTNDAGQCFHATGAGSQTWQASGSTCKGQPVVAFSGTNNQTIDGVNGAVILSNVNNVTLSNCSGPELLMHGNQNLTVSGCVIDGGGITTINAGQNIELINNTFVGGNDVSSYWSAALQCRTTASGVRLINNTVVSTSFGFYGYAPGAGCPGIEIAGGSYTAGNNDAIMCRRCPNISISDATLVGRLRTHANLGSITADNVTIVPKGGLHLDLRSQEGFGPGPTVLTITGNSNTPWACTGARCGAVQGNN